jgi:hypothetical protein
MMNERRRSNGMIGTKGENPIDFKALINSFNKYKSRLSDPNSNPNIRYIQRRERPGRYCEDIISWIETIFHCNTATAEKAIQCVIKKYEKYDKIDPNEITLDYNVFIEFIVEEPKEPVLRK